MATTLRVRDVDKSFATGGRPVQVLVTVEPAANPGSDGASGPRSGSLSEYRFEPAYVGLSHREALVQQTSAARPEHLARGLERALAATHAGLHVIAPARGEPRDAARIASLFVDGARLSLRDRSGRLVDSVDVAPAGRAWNGETYVLVNGAMVSGLLPVVGVPLPLISYGGTSAVTLLAGFGIMLSIYGHRKFIK